MAAVETARSRVFNKIAVALVLLAAIVYLIPLYWIGSTAFKPRAAATTVPPTVFFKPELTGFVKLFTKRVQLRKTVPEEKYKAGKWYEKLVYDAGQRIITTSPMVSRGSRWQLKMTGCFLSSAHGCCHPWWWPYRFF